MKLPTPFALSLSLFLTLQSVMGHGTVTSPISRVYTVRLEGPESPTSPAVQAAVAVAGPTPFYTWSQVSKDVPNYADPIFADSYASVIPDGKLASGDSGSGVNFSGLDVASSDWAWPATPAMAGNLDITWYATATHDPSYFMAWITTPDYDHTMPLSWDKMSFLGRLDLGSDVTKVDKEYRMAVTLPERTGRHVLYVAWQRIDPIGEVFFSTSDLIFEGEPDPNAPLSIFVSDSTVDEDAGTATVQITLSKAPIAGEDASVDYATASLSASDDDFTMQSGSLSFAPGELAKTLTIPIIDDSENEPEERFSVTLSNPTNATISRRLAAVVIRDDDRPTLPSALFEKTQDWQTGYQGWLVIANPGPEDWTNPTVTFDFDQALSWFGGGSRTDDGAGRHTVAVSGSFAEGEEIRFDMVIQPVSAEDPRGPSNVRVNGTAFPVLDYDSDYLLDTWEITHFGDLSATGAQDADSDGQTNLAEMISKTDPRDALDSLKLENGRLVQLEYQFDLASKHGVSYQLMRSTDLDGWVPQGTSFSGTGDTISLSIDQQDRLFVRIEATVTEEHDH